MIAASRPRYFAVMGLALRWPIGFGWGPTIALSCGRSWVLTLGLIELTFSVFEDRSV